MHLALDAAPRRRAGSPARLSDLLVDHASRVGRGGPAIAAAIDRRQQGAPWFESGVPSFGNGALVRAVASGLVFAAEPDIVPIAASIDAAVTHASSTGRTRRRSSRPPSQRSWPGLHSATPTACCATWPAGRPTRSWRRLWARPSRWPAPTVVRHSRYRAEPLRRVDGGGCVVGAAVAPRRSPRSARRHRSVAGPRARPRVGHRRPRWSGLRSEHLPGRVDQGDQHAGHSRCHRPGCGPPRSPVPPMCLQPPAPAAPREQTARTVRTCGSCWTGPGR